MESTLTSKGQLVIPKAIRDQQNLKSGSKFAVFVADDGSIVLRPLNVSFLKFLQGSIKKGALEILEEEKKKERFSDSVRF